MSRAAVASGLCTGPVAMSALSDEGLARRAIEGDKEAFAAIFDRHHQGLYRYCLALLGNAQDAQDALQNTMVKVLRAMPGEERRIVLKPWLYRIAHNESIELVRRRRETRPLDPGLAAVGAGLSEAAAARERLRVLISDLNMLPERQRGALIMRELAGLDFAEIGTAFGTSAAVVRQAIYEARLNLRQMDEGRSMSCERVTRALSDGDGRVARRRDLRSHLRTCPSCRDFGEASERREREFAALAPLPAAAAAGLLQNLLGGHGAAGGGFATALGGGAAKSLGASAALKGVATVAVVTAIGVGAADRGGLIDLRLPGEGHSQTIRTAQPAASGLPGTHATRSGSVAADAAAAAVAGAKGASPLHIVRATKTAEAPKSGNTPPPAAGAPADSTELTQRGEADAGQAASPEGTNSVPVSAPAAEDKEKQLPNASEHGQETAASHKAANHGQETSASHKAEDHGNAARSHPAHPATPSHPAQSPESGTEEESSLPPTSPVVPESNGNGNAKGKGNGKGNSPAAGAEESPPAHETGQKP
jgi:RNA polymerase sigma factor (sigma-70 family)